MPLVGGTHMGKHQRQEAEERQKCAGLFIVVSAGRNPSAR